MNDNKHLGHRARKRFGQNFLHDQGVINDIVDAIGPTDEAIMVEIGPGLAALTEPVAEQVEQLHVVELDRDLAARLATHPFLKDKLVIHQADAMKFDFANIARGQSKKMKVFGNLPYNISTPLMFHLFEYAEQIQDMHFMLQKEVVERLCAGPGTKDYGRLTIMAQYYCRAMPVLEVPPECFKPAPKVNSAVVRLMPRALDERFDLNPAMLSNVCHQAFNQRRKTLRNSLKQLVTEQELIDLDMDPTTRAERVPLQSYFRLSQYLSNKQAEQNDD